MLYIILAVFIALKIAGMITWSWFAVFIPLYIQVALLIIQARLYETRMKQKREIEFKKTFRIGKEFD